MKFLLRFKKINIIFYCNYNLKMSVYKDKINQNATSPYNISSNKSNLTEFDNMILSQQIVNNIKLQKEYSLSEMNDSNNYFNNNITPEQNQILKSTSYNKKNNKLTNIKINTSHSNFKTKNKNSGHIYIDSKPKKTPNLIRNIHYKPNIKKNNDNYRYQPITSFEQKLSKQLSRISNKYTIIKNRKFFNNQLTNTNLYWVNFPDYELYRQLKELETRKEFPNAFTKPRLKPLISQKKDKLGKLAQNLYEADQIDRFKKFIKQQYKNKVGAGEEV